MNFLLLLYLGISIIMSVITFALYGWDKRSARLNQWRVPESRLHACALLGGWPGAILGRAFFRHKTHKLGFTIVTWGIVLLHASAWVVIGLSRFR